MKFYRHGLIHFLFALCILTAGCGNSKSDQQAETPPPLKLEKVGDSNDFEVNQPERFKLAEVVQHMATPQLRVTGTVTKGQLLLTVQSADISGAFSDYRKAVADEQLAKTQLDRAQLLYSKGAISLSDLQIAEDTENKAKVDVETAAEHLRVLGNASLDRPSGIVEIRAPISGVITDQQVTNASGVQGLASPNPFTISDLSTVWIICDVYENDLANVNLGQKAEIRLNAYPDKVFTGTISNVGPVLDPNTRTAKVRIEVNNPGLMRPSMFVTATFNGNKKEDRAAVPATAAISSTRAIAMRTRGTSRIRPSVNAKAEPNMK